MGGAVRMGNYICRGRGSLFTIKTIALAFLRFLTWLMSFFLFTRSLGGDADDLFLSLHVLCFLLVNSAEKLF